MESWMSKSCLDVTTGVNAEENARKVCFAQPMEIYVLHELVRRIMWLVYLAHKQHATKQGDARIVLILPLSSCRARYYWACLSFTEAWFTSFSSFLFLFFFSFLKRRAWEK